MRIECSNCSEIVDTTARSVKNPFVCDECKESRVKRAAMAPLHKGGLPAVAGDCPTNCSCRLPNPPTEPECDGATVEATTELIQQLEADRESLKDELHTLQETMKNDRADFDRIVKQYASQTEDLGKKNFEFNKLLAHLLGKSFEIFCAKEDAEAGENAAIALLEMNIDVMDRATKEIIRLRSNVEGLEKDLQQAKHESLRYDCYWHEACARADRYRDEANKLKN